jgi:type IV secretion system protein VirB6
MSDFSSQSNIKSINSMALQQGGLGLVLTTLIVMAPLMAASFFQGMLGQFTAYSAFGGIGRNTGADSAGRTPGTPGYNADGARVNNSAQPRGDVMETKNFGHQSNSAYAGKAYSPTQDEIRKSPGSDQRGA